MYCISEAILLGIVVASTPPPDNSEPTVNVKIEPASASYILLLLIAPAFSINAKFLEGVLKGINFEEL